jgi:hypothetical protein
MSNLVRAVLVFAVALFATSTAHAGSVIPELDASGLAPGIGLAAAVILLLTHRSGGGRSDDERRP